MTSWLAVLPEIAFIVAILGLPGLLVARCLRFGWWDAVALSTPLSLAVLALANIASILTGMRWGMLVVVLATASTVLVCLLVMRMLGPVVARSSLGQADVEGRRVVGVVWDRRAETIAILATVAAAIVGAIAIARGTGTPHTINQTSDAAFHVNSISAVAQQHRASPSMLSNLGYPFGSGGFYPPTFAAAVSMLVTYAHVSPVVAANVSSVAIAILWPLTVSIAVRRLARPSAFGYFVAMVGAVTVSLFPAVLLAWGTVWPNALSVLALAPALVMVFRVLALDRARDSAEDPHGEIDWLSCVVVLVLLLPAMVFAQPNALFAIFFLSLPLLAWYLWRRMIDPSSDGRRKRMVAAGIGVALMLLVVVVTWLAYRVPAIAAIGDYHHSPVSWWLALVQVFTLSARMGFPNIAFAVLILVGIYVGSRHGRGRFLAATYTLIALLCFFAAVQFRLTMYLTGYWYNDSPRLFAILPVVGLPLAALGADALRRSVQQVLARRLGRESLSWRNRKVALSTASGLVVCLGILALQAGLGTARVSQVVAVTNQCSGPACLVTPGAQRVYAELAQTMTPEETIAGDPFTGEILAGQLAGHSAIYVTFSASKDPTAALVGLRFRYYREDHLVCAAVKTLNIGVILTGRKFHGETPEKRAPFVGFNFGDDAASIGLTKIASGGGLTAYRVGPCNSYDYPRGRIITPGQEAMFKQLASNAPAGMSVVGNPFTGAIFAGILSHRVGVFQKLDAPTDLASALVGARFSSYQSDWLVCAAVRSLKIGTAVDGRTYPGQTRADHQAYAGFDDLSTVPGLTPMVDKDTGTPLSGGGATAYSVGSCGTQ